MKRNILATTGLILGFALVSVLFQNCGFQAPSAVRRVANDNQEIDNSEKISFSSFRFVDGGGMRPPDMPMFDDDIEIKNEGGKLFANSETFNLECIKPRHAIGAVLRAKILEQIKNLKIQVVNNGNRPILMDAKTQQIILKFEDGTEKTVSLSDSGLRSGDLVAVNGAELVKLLKALNQAIPVACHVPEHALTQISSLHYESYGGFAPPSATNNRHDMNFVFSASGIKVDRSEGGDCFKPEFTLNAKDVLQMNTLISALQPEVYKAEFPIMDAPTTKITVTLGSGEVKVIHLSAGGAQNGDLYAAEGSALGNFLDALDQKIPIACH